MFWVEYVFVGIAYMYSFPAPYLTRLPSFGDETRADVATLLFQIWLLGLSMAAIFQDSIPHTYVIFVTIVFQCPPESRCSVAQLLGNALNTAWAGYLISRTLALRKVYEEYVVASACVGQDPLHVNCTSLSFWVFTKYLTYQLCMIRASADAPLCTPAPFLTVMSANSVAVM
jgi:hypothetical protein